MSEDNQFDIQPYIDDLFEEMSEHGDKKISRQELEKEFQKFIEYGVPPDQAKQTLLKKITGETTLKISNSAERTPIADLQPNTSSVSVLCRVISINPKEITSRGEQKTIFYGIFGDETGTLSFTAWNDFELEKGDVLKISNAYTKEWQGNIQLNLGDRTQVEKTDTSALPNFSSEPRDYMVQQLRSGLTGIDVTARILEITKREVDVGGTKKPVFSGLIGDETGKAQFTSWHDHLLKKDDVIKISGGYVKSWKGIPQLTFDEKATVTKLDAKKIPKNTIVSQQLRLSELVEKQGALDAETIGTVIEIRDGSGFVLRCPECNRVLQQSGCSIHGDVTGTPDLRLKLIVDDGTGVVTAILNREITELLLGKLLKELQELSQKEDGEKQMKKLLIDQLLSHRLLLRGNALGDEFGTTLIAHHAEHATLNLEKTSDEILKDLEDLL